MLQKKELNVFNKNQIINNGLEKKDLKIKNLDPLKENKKELKEQYY